MGSASPAWSDLEERAEVPISALEHYAYCPRQCALIHVEQTFEENLYTIRGGLVHERVVSGESSRVGDTRILRSVPLWSERLGLIGKADVVEMRPEGPYPVEYKVGRKRSPPAEVQLCAQALCLEEMLDVEVPRGAVFYAGVRRRREVIFDEPLRRATTETVEAVRFMLQLLEMPEAPNDERCRRCSLIHSCLPGVVSDPQRLGGIQSSLFRPLVAGTDDA